MSALIPHNAPGRTPPRSGWLAALRRLAAPRHGRCELCGVTLAADHRHLLETRARRLVCTCDACSPITRDGLRTVPRQVRRLADFLITDPQWEALQIPIGVAFCFHADDGGVVARYPGTAGTAESLLEPAPWSVLAAANPVLQSFAPEVEALLVNRLDGAREYFRAPIDYCYLLVALIRRHWRGWSGGPEAHAAITDFFAWMRDEPARLGAWNHA